MKVLAINGSLRAGSSNRMLLRAARLGTVGQTWEWQDADIGAMPHYNDDLLQGEVDTCDPATDGNLPDSVATFVQQLRWADALLIATPEYNYGPTGVLKNAIDWASRPAHASILRNKPVAITGAAYSPVGCARALGQLKQILAAVSAAQLPYPEQNFTLYGEQSFNADGLLHEATQQVRLDNFLAALQQFTEGTANLIIR